MYFKFFFYYLGKRIPVKNNTEGEVIKLSSVENHINVHILAGHVVATHDVQGLTTKKAIRIRRVSEARNQKLILVTALPLTRMPPPPNNCSVGDLYLDDGETYEPDQADDFVTHFHICHDSVTITTVGKPNNLNKINTEIGMIKVFGVINPPKESILDVISTERNTGQNKTQNVQVKYDYDKGVLTLLNKGGMNLIDYEQHFINWSLMFSSS